MKKIKLPEELKNSFPLSSMRARFTGIVYPGDTMTMKFWLNSTGMIFEAKTVERGKPVIVGSVEFPKGYNYDE